MPKDYRPIKDLISINLKKGAIVELVNQNPDSKRKNLAYVVSAGAGRKKTYLNIPLPFQAGDNFPADTDYDFAILKDGSNNVLVDGENTRLYTHFRVVERNPPKN